MSATEQTTGIPTGTWQHDPIHSSISFGVKHNTVMTFTGQFGAWEARLEDGRLEGSADVSSVRVDDENLVGHLQTPDFFDAEQFPKLGFESSSIERDGDRVTIAGDLTIKGTTKPIELTGTISGPVTDGYGNERIGLDVTTVVNRHDYGVSWNADLPGGAAMLEDDVTINANLALTQK
ncbi:MAG: YceI family protein [Gaiellaceae bacterium]